MDQQRLIVIGGAILTAGVLLYWHLWRAIAFLKPASVRVDIDTPGPTQVPGLLEPLDTAMKALGFTMLGSHLEHPRLGRALLCYDYVNREKKTFASLYGAGLFHFVTVTANDGCVLTANYRRPGANEPGRYLAGGIQGASAERLFKAHLRRLEEMPGIETDFSLDGRVAQTRAWFERVGVTELRRQNAVGLLWSAGALMLAAWAVVQWFTTPS